jgi:hypothetical protein
MPRPTIGQLDIGAPSRAPHGCVSCHVKRGKSDRRLNALLPKIKGHPNVSRLVETVPKDCGICHKKGSNAPLLKAAIHKMHSKGFALGAFAGKLTDPCLHCHRVNVRTGKIGVKSGLKNW